MNKKKKDSDSIKFRSSFMKKYMNKHRGNQEESQAIDKALTKAIKLMDTNNYTKRAQGRRIMLDALALAKDTDETKMKHVLSTIKRHFIEDKSDGKKKYSPNDLDYDRNRILMKFSSRMGEILGDKWNPKLNKTNTLVRSLKDKFGFKRSSEYTANKEAFSTNLKNFLSNENHNNSLEKGNKVDEIQPRYFSQRMSVSVYLQTQPPSLVKNTNRQEALVQNIPVNTEVPSQQVNQQLRNESLAIIHSALSNLQSSSPNSELEYLKVVRSFQQFERESEGQPIPTEVYDQFIAKANDLGMISKGVLSDLSDQALMDNSEKSAFLQDIVAYHHEKIAVKIAPEDQIPPLGPNSFKSPIKDAFERDINQLIKDKETAYLESILNFFPDVPQSNQNELSQSNAKMRRFTQLCQGLVF
ncbi:MAG: hypothetical protein IPP74_10455 [Alphaproteobacteria bacterium]|nr:hypothetical protein [Alphaproteobacteria bacterium]